MMKQAETISHTSKNKPACNGGLDWTTDRSMLDFGGSLVFVGDPLSLSDRTGNDSDWDEVSGLGPLAQTPAQ